ncbi:MAG: hypothetical protein AAGN46_04585 [Acidobacteriota bacterium]
MVTEQQLWDVKVLVAGGRSYVDACRQVCDQDDHRERCVERLRKAYRQRLIENSLPSENPKILAVHEELARRRRDLDKAKAEFSQLKEQHPELAELSTGELDARFSGVAGQARLARGFLNSEPAALATAIANGTLSLQQLTFYLTNSHVLDDKEQLLRRFIEASRKIANLEAISVNLDASPGKPERSPGR